MEKSTIKLCGNKVYGIEVSEYGLEHGYLDYRTMSKILGDCILNNNIFMATGYENWELESGEEENEDGEYRDVYQYYIIDWHGAEFLEAHTDEIVYYNKDLDMYLWGVTHFGTSWDYVLSDVKLV